MNATVQLFDEKYDITIKELKYQNGNTALVAYHDDGQVFGTITINTSFELAEEEIVVKTYMENEWVTQLLTQLPDVFKDTGNKVYLSQYAKGDIWRYKKAS